MSFCGLTGAMGRNGQLRAEKGKEGSNYITNIQYTEQAAEI